MNHVALRSTIFTRNVSANSLPRVTRLYPRANVHDVIRLSGTSSNSNNWKHRAEESSKRLKGDLGFGDTTRNVMYLVMGGGTILLVLGGVYFSLNSEWFDQKLKFDENDPDQWPTSFMEFIAIPAQLDRFSIDKRYVEKLKKGSVHPNEDIQRLSLSALATLATDRVKSEELAKTLPLQAIFKSLHSAQSLEVLTSTCDLCDILSERGVNAPMLLNKQNLTIIGEMCHHPKAEVTDKVAGMLANLSKNNEVLEHMVRLIPPMYSLYKTAPDSYTKTQISIALRNVLTNSAVAAKYNNLLQSALSNAQIPADDLKSIEQFTQEDPWVYRVKALAASAVVGGAYGGLRWTVHGLRKGRTGDDLLKLWKTRVPATALMSSALYLYWTTDTWLWDNVVDPRLNSQFALYGGYTLSLVAMGTVFWATQAIAPFSVLPSVIYPLYKYYKDGDRKYQPAPSKEGALRM